MALVGSVVGSQARRRRPTPSLVEALSILVVVTGHPGIGKTTFARALSADLDFPLFSKDVVKERLFGMLGWGDRSWSRRLSQAASSILYDQLEAVLPFCSAVAESNFEAASAGDALQGVLARTRAYVVQVVLAAPPEIALERFRRRAATGERHPGHLDQSLVSELEPLLLQPYVPPELPGPLVTVDASDLDAIDVSALASALADL